MKVGILSSVLVAAMLTGCASISDPKLLQPLTKITLVSVTSNPKLYYVGDQPPQASILDLAMNSASNDGKNNAVVNKLLEKTDTYVTKGEELLAAALSSAKGSTLIPRDAMFTSSAYTGAADDGVFANSLHPAGYKFVKIDAVAAGLTKELGANGLITANFLFQKAMQMGMMGTGSLGAQTTLTIQAFDSQGKLVFSKMYVGVSKQTAGVALDIYDPTKYAPVVEESAQFAVDKFAADLAAR